MYASSESGLWAQTISVTELGVIILLFGELSTSYHSRSSRAEVYTKPVCTRADFLLAAYSWFFRSALAAEKTALDRYVAAPDPNYKYELVSTTPGAGFTTYVLDLTSQQWRTKDRSEPAHLEALADHRETRRAEKRTPASSTSPADPITTKPPTAPDPMLPQLALGHRFGCERAAHGAESAAGVRRRNETAHRRRHHRLYLGQIPARRRRQLAAAPAHDQGRGPRHGHRYGFAKSGGGVTVDKFVVAGGSKRGWTTWTTAAVDPRVIAIVPFVIDLLNIVPSFEHHYRAYGFWAPAVKDYQDMGIMDRTNTPRYKELMKIVEPYSYRDRLTMPKYMINASGDQFFLPDSSQFYYDGLKGEKYLRYVPNTNHSLKGSDARESMQAFYESILTGSPRPKFSWRFEKDGSIKLESATQPTEVRLWQATNPKARDFRLDTIGKAYTSVVLTDQGHGKYVGRVPKPSSGFTAYFVEMTYPGVAKIPFKFTTGVRVIPDILPFPPPPR